MKGGSLLDWKYWGFVCCDYLGALVGGFLVGETGGVVGRVGG
jgi:hypothetical protein